MRDESHAYLQGRGGILKGEIPARFCLTSTFLCGGVPYNKVLWRRGSPLRRSVSRCVPRTKSLFRIASRLPCCYPGLDPPRKEIVCLFPVTTLAPLDQRLITTGWFRNSAHVVYGAVTLCVLLCTTTNVLSPRTLWMFRALMPTASYRNPRF